MYLVMKHLSIQFIRTKVVIIPNIYVIPLMLLAVLQIHLINVKNYVIRTLLVSPSHGLVKDVVSLGLVAQRITLICQG